MIKRLLTFVLLITFSGSLFAEISVKSFRRLETDLDARLNEAVKDQNGDLCAIIKVVTSQTGFTFDCGQIGIMKTVQKTGEIWVYVPFSTKRITIAHPQLGFLRDYMFPMPVEKATVYELVLTTDKVVTTIEKSEMDTQWLLINTDPTGADVYINDQPVGKTPYQNEFPVGKYTYRLQKDLYNNEAGIVELKPGDQKQIIKLQLKPNYGTLQISSTPENGAKVSLNGMPTGKTTPCKIEMVPAGEHTVKVSYDMYETTSQKVTVIPGETKPVIINMNPAFSEVSLQSEPKADIYINGIFKANGSWQGRLTPAVYSFEAKLEKHTTATEKQTVDIGIPVNLTLHPKPRTGNLKVISNPFEATIKINGNVMGQTPTTLRNLLIGDYTTEISLPGYSTAVEKATVTEGQTAIINTTLINGRNSTINSDPSGATLTIDGVAVGTTPYTGPVSYGSHKIKLELGLTKAYKNLVVNESDNSNYNLTFTAGSANLDISNTSNASIYIDGEYKGTGSWQGKLASGTYRIEVKKDGLKPAQQQVELYEGDNQKITLEPVQSFGTLDANTDPAGATILINGKVRGTTPNLMTNLPSGNYDVELRKEGFSSVLKKVIIRENETTKLDEKLSAGLVFSITSIPSGVDIFVDGIASGKTPKDIALSYSTHIIKVTDGKISKESQLDVSKESATLLMYQLYECNQTKSITSFPSGANVIVDGTIIGTTPMRHLLQNKELKVKIGKAGFVESTNTLRCEDDGLNVRLKQKTAGHLFIEGGLAVPLISSQSEFLSNMFYQVRIAYMKTMGFYVKYETSGSPQEIDYTTANIPSTYFYYSSDTPVEKYSRVGFVAGAMLHVSPITLYAGAGFGYYNHYITTDLYRYSDNSYVKQISLGDPNSVIGMESEAGLIFGGKTLTFSVGVANIGFKYYEISAGLGIMF